MNSVVVIVPVYKTCLSVDEKVSFLQTLRMLGSHPICIVCPETLDFAIKEEEVSEGFVSVFVERFPNVYFEGVSGYNRLLLSEEFYSRFVEYDYMLICQLDAYVFRDELLEWCSKDYDYIGAPLFGRHFDIEHGMVGNGGFCLRRVKVYLDFFKGKKNVFKIGDIANRISLRSKPFTRWLVWILMALGWRNKPKTVARRWQYNEDTFWSLVLTGTNYELNKPEPLEALRFSFERFPSEAFSLLEELPFGCHAWKKYQYEEFWKDHVR